MELPGGEPETPDRRRAGVTRQTAPPETYSGVTPHETVTKGRTW